MPRAFRFCLIVLFSFAAPVVAQKQPHVDKVVESLDANKDGSVSRDEADKSPRYSRQFARWDTDKDGTVSRADIVKFRSKFGIAADGSRMRGGAGGNAMPRPFTIPDVESLARVGRGTARLNRAITSNSEFVLKTAAHGVVGDDYVVLTDHTQPEYLEALGRLVKHRKAKLIRVDDLAKLYEDADRFRQTRDSLRTAKYLAIAPRLQSFRENMVLSMWELLSTLDEDPELDCFPGFLVASNPASFAVLVDQSIGHAPVPAAKLKPFAINQVRTARETRSLQKSGILRKHFTKANLTTPIVAVYGQQAATAPRLKGDQTWNLKVQGRKQFVKSFEQPIADALADSNLVVMHGHGIPGMSCSVDVDAIPEDCRGKVLLSGSCFSASPTKSDLIAMGQAPGGYTVEPRDAFVLRAIDNGAIVAFGHQRLSSGFPHLFPVLESWTKGQTVGEAYQQLINGLIDLSETKSGGFILSEEQKRERSPRQQRLLYVVIGDPALQPFEPLDFAK